MSDEPDGLLSVASTSVVHLAAHAATATESRDPAARWDVRGELGWGGMGRVLLVWDRWLGREVAIKEPIANTDTARFEREALITARLEHPGIIPIFDIGSAPDGRPWFAMRVARGRSLAAVLEQTRTAAERAPLLRLFLTACEAVAYAHDRGVVHRDLKPANIMLGAFGESQVIDWGLALSPGFPEPQTAAVAADGTSSPIGTPRYMSPEQVRGESLGPTSDVFSLGVILFELASGRRAFDQPDTDGVYAALRGAHMPSLKHVVPEVAPELAAIVARAMSPDVASRYPTAKELADDLTRFLDGRRVGAYSYSPLALLVRLARAWRAPLIVAGLALALLLALGIAAFVRIAAERDSADERLAVSLAVSAASAAHSGARAEAEVLAAHALARAPLASARGVLAALAGPRPLRTKPTAATPIPKSCRPLDIAGDAVLCQTSTGDGTNIGVASDGVMRWERPFPMHRGALFVDEGRTVSVAHAGSVHQLDARTGEVARAAQRCLCNGLLRHAGDGVSMLDVTVLCASIVGRDTIRSIPVATCGSAGVAALAAHPDRQRWALICKSGDLILGRGDVAAEPMRAVSGEHAARVSALAFVASRNELLIGTMTGVVLRYDTDSRETNIVTQGPGLVHRIAVDRSDSRALIIRDFGAPLVLDLANAAALGHIQPWRDSVFAFDPGGTIRVAGRTLERWDFSAVRPNRFLLRDGISSLAVSPDGSRLAIGRGPWLSLIDPLERARLGDRRWQDDLVKDIAFAPGGRVVVAHGLGERAVRGFTADSELASTRTTVTTPVRRLAMLADGSLLVSTWGRGLFRFKDSEPGLNLHPVSMRDLVVSGDGRRVAVLGDDQILYSGRDLHSGGALRACGTFPNARALALDPRSDTVFVAEHDGIVVGCARELGDVRYASDAGEVLAVAASDNWLAGATGEGTVQLWRRGEASVYAVYRAHDARVEALVIDPAERWLASGGWDGVVSLLTLPPPEVAPEALEAAWQIDLKAAFGAGAAPGEWLR